MAAHMSSTTACGPDSSRVGRAIESSTPSAGVYAATLKLVPPRSTPIVIDWAFSKSISDHRQIRHTRFVFSIRKVKKLERGRPRGDSAPQRGSTLSISSMETIPQWIRAGKRNAFRLEAHLPLWRRICRGAVGWELSPGLRVPAHVPIPGRGNRRWNACGPLCGRVHSAVSPVAQAHRFFFRDATPNEAGGEPRMFLPRG